MNLLVIGAVWPEPRSSAAGRRMMDLLSFFLKQGADILFLTQAEKRPHSACLPEAITCGELFLNDARSDALFSAYNPDIVLFDRFMMEEQFGWRIAKTCPAALRILDTVDVHSLRSARKTALAEKRKRNMQDWFADLAFRELAAILRSDVSLLMSEAERKILQAELPIPSEKLYVLPFLLRPAEYNSDTWPVYSQRRGIVTIGSFLHGPNRDSVEYIKHQLWPKIREQQPQVNLHVYGADMPPNVEAWNDPEQGFFMQGRAEDARHVLQQARLCLAPLRYGAGLKGKLLDAMLAGTPSVTTPVGAEGMAGDLPWPGRIEADADGLVDATLDLYSQAKHWEDSQASILPVLETFDAETLGPLFLERINWARRHKHEKSSGQWMGELLQHHHHRSTEYMSRWIEEKNRKR